MLDLSSRKVYGALAEQCVGGDAKADKVETAVAGHLAGLDANGNLTDSGVSPTEEVTVEGNPVTFDSPFEQDAKSVVVSVKPIQAGSGTPSPENIRPISGIDEVEIEVSGKNQFDGDWQYGLIDTTTGEVLPHEYVKYHDYIRVKPSTWYTMSAYNMHDLVNPFDIFGYDKNKNYVGLIPINILSNTLALFAEKFQIPSNVAFIRMHIADSTLGTSDKQQLEMGETYTAYEPYTEHTTTIPLPSTLYDADVDVTEGSGDSRYGYIASYNGETLPGAWISDRDVYTGSNSPTIGAEVCYELATPTTISLTPTDVELLEGTNVVSTNGEKIAVTYGRSLWQDIDDLKTDTERKLDKSDVADVEGDTASRAYSVNEFMLRSDGFYRVTQPIASGASITASNTTKTTIGAVLTALLNA